MFKNMKPLPKALIIFVPIALAIGGYMKFGPEPKVESPTPVVQQVEPTVVSAETPTSVRLKFDKQEGDTVAKPEAAPVESAPAETINDNAGLAALLKAGKK